MASAVWGATAYAEPLPTPSASPAPQTATATEANVEARTLGGHRFLRPVADESAFLATTIGFRQGLLFLSDGNLTVFGLQKPLMRAAAIESIDATVRIVDWFAVSVTGDLQALLAASEAATYTTTSSIAGGVRFGPAFRILRIAKTGTQVAIRPFYRVTTGALLDVTNVPDAIEARLAKETPPATQRDAVLRAQTLSRELFESAVAPLQRSAAGGSLHVANAISPDLGVQLAYELQRERFTLTPYDFARKTRDTFYFVSVTHRFSGTVSFDGKRLGVPVTALGQLSASAGTLAAEAGGESTNLDTVLLLGGGLYYTGRASLQIGAHAAVERGLSPYRTSFGMSERPQATYGEFSIRYFF